MMNNGVLLRRHRLKHLPAIPVDPELLNSRFSSSCSMSNCHGNCCRHGVWADLAERDSILAHAELIKRHLEPQQEHDPAKWFDPEIVDDPDYPSGKAIGTNANETGCVFLDSRGRCVLQKAATEDGLGKFFLKPFSCVAYPITIGEGVLMIDDEEFPGNPQCCTPDAMGTLTVFDVCSEELEFVLGNDGLGELREQTDTHK